MLNADEVSYQEDSILTYRSVLCHKSVVSQYKHLNPVLIYFHHIYASTSLLKCSLCRFLESVSDNYG
jgi:hypothetical protein